MEIRTPIEKNWWTDERCDWLRRQTNPCFLYSAETLESNVPLVRALWSRIFGARTGRVFASVKCNPNLHLLNIIKPLVDGFDVSSLEELNLLERIGESRARLTLSGPAKTDSLLQNVVSNPVGALHVDSLDELEFLLARPPSRSLAITLRLSPEGWSFKLGLTPSEAHRALERIRNEGAQCSGLHLYLGRESFSPVKLHEGLEQAHRLVEKQPELFSSRSVYIGAGFAGLAQKDRWSVDGFTVETTQYPLFESFHLECGRAFFENCGFYFAPVLAVKTEGRKRPVAIIDGGNHHFAERLVSETGEEKAYAPVACRDGQLISGQLSLRKMAIAGDLCQDRDLLHPSSPLPEDLRRGDWLLFPNRGAYGLSASNNQFIGMNGAREWLLKSKIFEITPAEFRSYHASFRPKDKSE